MSTLSQFGSGVRGVQTGYVATSSATFTGSGEQYYYVDITVSALANITKCFLTFDGAWNSSLGFVALYSAASSGSAIATTRVINSTTIRIMTSSAYTVLVGRWTLVEYN